MSNTDYSENIIMDYDGNTVTITYPNSQPIQYNVVEHTNQLYLTRSLSVQHWLASQQLMEDTDRSVQWCAEASIWLFFIVRNGSVYERITGRKDGNTLYIHDRVQM